MESEFDINQRRGFHFQCPVIFDPVCKDGFIRHLHTAETYILLRGRINVLFYNDDKQVQEKQELSVALGNYGVHIPAGQWHTLEVLESGTVIFEVKDGPYTPLTEDNIMKL